MLWFDQVSRSSCVYSLFGWKLSALVSIIHRLKFTIEFVRAPATCKLIKRKDEQDNIDTGVVPDKVTPTLKLALNYKNKDKTQIE